MTKIIVIITPSTFPAGGDEDALLGRAEMAMQTLARCGAACCSPDTSPQPHRSHRQSLPHRGTLGIGHPGRNRDFDAEQR